MTSHTKSQQHTSLQSRVNNLIAQLYAQQVKIQDLTKQVESSSQKNRTSTRALTSYKVNRSFTREEEIEDLQVSITASHKKKELVENSLEREQKLDMLNFALLQTFSQDKNIAQEKERSRSLLNAALLRHFES